MITARHWQYNCTLLVAGSCMISCAMTCTCVRVRGLGAGEGRPTRPAKHPAGVAPGPRARYIRCAKQTRGAQGKRIPGACRGKLTGARAFGFWRPWAFLFIHSVNEARQARSARALWHCPEATPKLELARSQAPLPADSPQGTQGGHTVQVEVSVKEGPVQPCSWPGPGRLLA